ncbi:MAG TPA: hypothetical protein VGT99_13150 [Gammaproteobacteria bacterium]|nr:hypothetical protein [Gammaproteobacteria bacterium]
MDLRQHSQAKSPRPPRRLARWRAGLLLLALTCAVSLYSIEATHNHRTVLDDLRCPVCHVVGHSALDVYTPDLTPAFNLALLFFVLLPVAAAGAPRRVLYLKPQTRAPPSLA